MPDPIPRRTRVGRKGRRCTEAAAQEVTTAREQASPSQGKPDERIVTEQEQREKLTLKDGSEVDARSALVLLGLLRAKMRVRPEEFRSLLGLAQGHPDEVAAASLQPLQDQGLLDATGAISPVCRSIILNAYTVTPEGPVLVSPFRIQTEADKQAVERAEGQNDQVLRNWVRGPNEDDLSR